MAERDLFLGFDIGTTAIKGGLFDSEGRLVAYARRTYETMRPTRGIVEQDPVAWTDGVVATMDEMLGEDRAERVAAVGLCSQVNTEAFVDARGRALAPAITWQDNRAAPQAAALDAAISAADRIAWWGVPMPIGASHVLAHLQWMASERPDLYERTRYVLTPKDYCLLILAGVAATDPISNFCVVGNAGTYIEPLVDRVQGAAERLAPLRFPTEVVGEIRLGTTGRFAPVVASTMDAWSGLIGSGVHGAGQGVYISGTSEILAVASANRFGAPGVVTFPDAGLTVHAGPTQSGGDALRWWSEVIDRDIPSTLALAGKASRSDRAILFLPHLEGERAPLWDASLRGAFSGLDRRAKASDMALAILEGVACSGRMLLEALDAAGGEAVSRLFHAGRGAESDLWSQIRADCLGRPLDRVACLEVGCLGAAVMAAVGVKAFASIPSAVAAMTRVERTFEPNIAARPRYEDLYEAYLRTTEALAPHPLHLARRDGGDARRRIGLA